MWYYLVDYIPSDHGARPALPAQAGFLLLAAPSDDRPWGLFTTDGEVALSDRVRAVPAATAAALRAAERYPPALALARDDMSRGAVASALSDSVFCEAYTARLQEHMRLQPAAPFLFVEAIGDELGYLARGEFYWVLRYLRGAGTVRWVSADYFIYENPVADFALSNAQLESLLLSFPGHLTNRCS